MGKKVRFLFAYSEKFILDPSSLLPKKYMSKTVFIQGKEYPRKRLARVVLGSGKAALIKHKDMALFSHGIAVLKLEGGRTERFQVGQTDEQLDVFFYDTAIENEQIIIFSDEQRNKRWKSIFIYLFDDEGVFLIFASRELMNLIGMLCESGSTVYVSEIRQRALNLATLVMPELAEDILEQEKLGDNISLIEVDYGK